MIRFSVVHLVDLGVMLRKGEVGGHNFGRKVPYLSYSEK